jgi:hypothetical protein
MILAGRAASAVVTLLLLSAEGHASSVSAEMVTFAEAVARSARVVKGRVIGPLKVTVEGAKLRGTEIAVEKVLKGAPAPAGEHLLLFSPAEWTYHTVNASPLGVAMSYSVPHYDTPLPPAAMKRGATVIAFVDGEPAPTGFPPSSAFQVCSEGFERPSREKDVARIKSAEFDKPVALKMHEIAVLPYDLEIELLGFQRTALGEAARIEERHGSSARRVVLAYAGQPVAPPPAGKGDWQGRLWQMYEVLLVGMTYGEEASIRVGQSRRRPPAGANKPAPPTAPPP